MKRDIAILLLWGVSGFFGLQAQQQTDSNAPLHLMQPDYQTEYKIPDQKEIVEVLDRIYSYLESATPAAVVDQGTGTPITDPASIKSLKGIQFQQGDFRLTSYEWGVTYAGMLRAAQTTGDIKYAGYTYDRLSLFAEIYPRLRELEKSDPTTRHMMRPVLHPHALDDAGAICASMIKARQLGSEAELDPMIVNYIDYISNVQFRLEDGTLARNRPMKNSLWLDDLFMSVPALARMGDYSGDTRYFDDAVKQVLQFSGRMFNHEKGLFMHAYVLGMDDHPERDKVLEICREHIRGLAACQSPYGLWHQLLDRNDSYLETSATAIFTYSIAKAINKGYVSASAYGPMVCLAWNALETKVTGSGQVEGTCVGTGMGFDPAFYYYRPVSVYAAHGYGPLLLAGAEMIELLNTTFPKINDSAIQFYDHKIESNAPIFSEE